MDAAGLSAPLDPACRYASRTHVAAGHRCVTSGDDVDEIVRRVVAEIMDGVGIDNTSFVGRERARANLAFLQMLREQHEERGREFRRGLFQNSGNLVALAMMSLVLLAGGYLVGHGFTLK